MTHPLAGILYHELSTAVASEIVPPAPAAGSAQRGPVNPVGSDAETPGRAAWANVDS